MPQRKSGIDELKKNNKRRLRNLDIKTALRKSIKAFKSSVEEKNKDEAAKNLSLVFKKLDKASKTNIIHQNTVARRKSLFTKLLTNIA